MKKTYLVSYKSQFAVLEPILSKTKKIIALNEAEAEQKLISFCMKKMYKQFWITSIAQV